MSSVPSVTELKTLMAPGAQNQSGTVPVFAPDGTLGDIPQSSLAAAVKAGAKPGVTMRAPDGSLGVVPADRYQDAYKAGAKVVPLEQQDTDHPDFWKQAMDLGKQVAARYQPSLQMMAGAQGLKNVAAEAPAVQPPVQASPETPAPAQAAPEAPAAPVPQATATPAPKGNPVYRDATLNKRNIPEYAGEAESEVSKPSPLQQAAALKQPVHDIIDQAIPPTGSTKATNLLTKGRIEFQLQRGNVEAAQAILDTAKKPISGEVAPTAADLWKKTQESLAKLDPSGKQSQPITTRVIKDGNLYQYKGGQFLKNGQIQEDAEGIVEVTDALEPQKFIEGSAKFADEAPKALKPASQYTQFPPEAPISRGTTNDIRAQQPEAIAARRANLMDDKATGQEMNWNLERHGWQVESEARKEFIARNSTGMTKGELIRQARVAQPPAGTTVPGEADMQELLQKSLENALKKKPGATN